MVRDDIAGGVLALIFLSLFSAIFKTSFMEWFYLASITALLGDHLGHGNQDLTITIQSSSKFMRVFLLFLQSLTCCVVFVLFTYFEPAAARTLLTRSTRNLPLTRSLLCSPKVK